jgi:hypothetical protein
MTTFMIAGKYSQRPELDGFSGLYDEHFAEPFGSVPADAIPAVLPPVATQAPVTTKKDNITVFIAMIMILAIFAYNFL